MKNTYYELFAHNLKNQDFPPIVALTGGWGVGKTYYITNELMPALIDDEALPNKVEYISLTGVSKLSDFKDKLISKTYFTNSNDIGHAKGLLRGTLAFIQTATKGTDEAAASSALNAIVKGASGAIRESVLSRVENVIFVIDDLERVSDKKVINQILGECLDLSLNNHVKFIIVFNEDKTKGNIQGSDKFFSAKIVYSKSYDDLIKLLLIKYSNLNNYEDGIKIKIKEKGLTNIRVLMRLFGKLSSIYESISSNPQFDINLSMDSIIPSAIEIAYLHYIEGLTATKIKSAKSENLKKDNFKTTRALNDSTEALIDFICNETVCIVELSDLGYLPENHDAVDKLIFETPYNIEKEVFISSITKLEHYISEPGEKKSLVKWFKACERYMYLCEMSYINDNLNIELKLKNYLEQQELTRDSYTVGYRRLSFNNQFILNEYAIFEKEINDKKEQEQLTTLYSKAESSWELADLDFYNLYKTSSLITKESASKWFNMITNWKESDIGLFATFIHSRYNDFNSESFNKDIEGLHELNTKIKQDTKDMEAGQRLGALKTLMHNLEIAHQQLTKKWP
ncbi:P-loop NTPase fold protein [Vibrio sp. EJY3]|uniref:P-loop NTPase fold protein n=1 Tax=Vibrio sp. (strain EJY3) TaxID=1116375 RepID=UPI000243B5F2|nr:P-loop NTPase fold protein [Vibrio sp. EJY3]AEX21992.1 KAP P-loop domain-containing protein [Vibrio sp. EJY3]